MFCQKKILDVFFAKKAQDERWEVVMGLRPSKRGEKLAFWVPATSYRTKTTFLLCTDYRLKSARGIITATKRARAGAAKGWRQRLGWWAMKRAMTRAARVIAMATKRAMVSNGDNMGNGYGKEGGGHLTAATMAMVMGTAQRTWLLALRLERRG
jgi:hypothetical protein